MLVTGSSRGRVPNHFLRGDHEHVSDAVTMLMLEAVERGHDLPHEQSAGQLRLLARLLPRVTRQPPQQVRASECIY